MAFATGAQTKLGLVAETVFGTTPTTPSFTSQRFASADFNLARAELLDPSITGTRQYQYTKTGNSSISGSISGPFAHENFDSLLESAFYSTFNTNVLKFGNTLKSFSIEEAQTDIAQYRLFKGMVVNTVAISSPIDGLTTIDFGLLGLSQVQSGTSADADGYQAQPLRQPFTHCGGTISEGGAPIAYVNSVDLSISNNLETAYVWGNCSPADLIPGRVDVTGTITVFFQDAAMINKFISGAYSSLSFTLSDGTNTMQFELPKILYTGATLPVDGTGQRIITMPFRAVYDETAASTVVVTRSA